MSLNKIFGIIPLLVIFSGSTFAQGKVYDYKSLSGQFFNKIEFDSIPDSNAIHTFHIRFTTLNKKVKVWEFSNPLYVQYFKNLSLLDSLFLELPGRSNANYILPVAVFVISSNKGVPVISIGDRVSNDKVIRELYPPPGSKIKNILLPPVIATLIKRIYE